MLSRTPWCLSGKESTCNAGGTGDAVSILGSGKASGGENGNPLQYSCLINPNDRGAWQATVQRNTESYTTKQLSARTHTQLDLVLPHFQCHWPLPTSWNTLSLHLYALTAQNMINGPAVSESLGNLLKHRILNRFFTVPICWTLESLSSTLSPFLSSISWV